MRGLTKMKGRAAEYLNWRDKDEKFSFLKPKLIELIPAIFCQGRKCLNKYIADSAFTTHD